MVKVLRVFLILMLPVSIAAVVIELNMFKQREELRLRSDRIETAIASFARKIAAAKEPVLEAIELNVDAAAIGSLETMEQSVATINKAIDARLGLISDTRQAVVVTREDLGGVRKELASNVQKRDALRKETASFGDVMRKKEADIAQAEAKIEQVDRQIAELNQQVESQDRQIARIEEDKQGMVRERERLEEAIKEVLPPTPIPAAVARKLVGTVVRVDAEWNFVILDIGKKHGLKRDVNMLVHRGEAMIGRLKVASVQDTMAVGHLDTAWSADTPQPGDRAFIQ